MKKICYAFAALAAIAAVSCQKESNTENVPGTLTATFANPASKVTYTETEGNALQPVWEVDDEIIGFDDAGSTYTFTVIEVKSTTATLIADKPVADGTYHLIYKSGAQSTDIQEKSLTVSYTDQAGNETMPAVMLADGEVSGGSCNFEFKNAGAIIGISALKGVPASSTISKITVTGANLSEGKVSLDEGSKLKLAATAKTGDAISTATLSGITTTDANGTLSGKVYIAVPAGAQISKVSATVGTDSYTYTLASAYTCIANDYLFVKDQTFKKDVVLPAGALPGVFTVSNYAMYGDKKRQVYFSKGNLSSIGTSALTFADNQYSTGNKFVGSKVISQYLTDDRKTLTGGWECLALEEMLYLVEKSVNFSSGSSVQDKSFANANRAGKYRFGVTIAGVANCLVLLPDKYTYPAGRTSIKGSYTADEWAAAEANGAVCMYPGQYWCAFGAKDDYGYNTFTIGKSGITINKATYASSQLMVRTLIDVPKN